MRRGGGIGNEVLVASGLRVFLFLVLYVRVGVFV